MHINNLGHITKMAAMPIYGKNSSKIFSRTGGLISKFALVNSLMSFFFSLYLYFLNFMTTQYK